MTDLQVKYHDLEERKRSNVVNEDIKRDEAETKRQQLVFERMKAEAALKQASAAKSQAEAAKWRNIIDGIDRLLDAFTLSPKSQSEFFRNVGQGFGSSAGGVSDLMGAFKGMGGR